MNAWFRSPELAELSQRLGAFCRYGTSLGQKLSELTILAVARHWTAQAEWCIHKPIALEAGIPATVIDAIEARRQPDFAGDEASDCVYDVVTQMLRSKALSDATYLHAIAILGETRLVELIAVIGYYTSVAMVLNAFDVPVPEDRVTAAPLK